MGGNANTIEGYTINEDNTIKKTESGRIGLFTVTEKEDSNSTAKFTATSVDVQAGLVGVEAEISFQIEDYENKK